MRCAVVLAGLILTAIGCSDPPTGEAASDTEVLQVLVVTTGSDLDPDGYILKVDARPPLMIEVNGTTNLKHLASGAHRVRLDGIAEHCSLEGEVERTLLLRESATPDTVQATFQLTCTRVFAIAFQSDLSIVVAHGDGSNAVALAPGSIPAWSPDGEKIAFTSVTCDYYYCWEDGLAVMTLTPQRFVQLTPEASDREPAWRPDGSRIAFTRSVDGRHRLFLMDADGSGALPIPLPETVVAWNPAWSPDGTRLAFTCVVDQDNVDVCLAQPNGAGLLRLTSDPAEDAAPAWSPDGTRIVFITRRFTGTGQLAVMNADGSGVRQVGQVENALDPAWSPDGSAIVFAVTRCEPCRSDGLFVIAPDGTGLRNITLLEAYAPAWRP